MFENRESAARHFIKTWSNRGYEKGESQSFWYQLLHDLLGVDTPANFISFELPVHLKSVKFIDAYIPSTKVVIEQKSANEDLLRAKRQSDNEKLTPYEQALRYSAGLSYSMRPRWIVTCNFKSFLVYDMEKIDGEPFEIKLKSLEREYHLLRFLIDDGTAELRHKKQLSFKAGELIGSLYDELHRQYVKPESDVCLRSLNILCVRLVFCLFAEDSCLFGASRSMFHDYLSSYKPMQMRKALIDLFNILNTPEEERDPYTEPQLAAFPFVNGGLFADENVEIPNLTPAIADLLLSECSAGFEWRDISPTIFGALFEDTMNPETRREGCMHYTSVENIHRVIDPLLLNDLRAEQKQIMQIAADKTRRKRLVEFLDKLGSLRFLDPACGSGNFLTETYLSLRRIENEVLAVLYSGERQMGGELTPIKVSIENFYGIEINDFAVTVARSALWIAEAQMMMDTERIVSRELNFLPLRSYSHIVNADALTVEWDSVAPRPIVSYVIGNPPFKGKKSRSARQKTSLTAAIGDDCQGSGNMDIVSGWYLKAARYMQGTGIRTAFVSTINITRGEQASLLWKSLLGRYGLTINFAYKPFVWNSESIDQAQVHCTIIGISPSNGNGGGTIYSVEEIPQKAKNISPYLRDEETTFVVSRTTPICDVPATGIGNKPIDDQNYLFTDKQKSDFLALEPNAAKYFREWYGANELIKGKHRWLLWLAKCPPQEQKEMPYARKRIENVKKFRMESSDAGTRRLADYPTKFHVTNLPESDIIVIPEVSSENRDYIPMWFFRKEELEDKLFSNLVKLMPNATLFHFGILQSDVHMAWVRAVCGYKDFRPRYSTQIVFNNFPWPRANEGQKEKIASTAKSILDARAEHGNCTIDTIYNSTLMPDSLREAHRKNDAAVRSAYGFKPDTPEEEIVGKLMTMYRKITSSQNN
ncbi:MAG: DNA methyltransferase [Prevotella sp.]